MLQELHLGGVGAVDVMDAATAVTAAASLPPGWRILRDASGGSTTQGGLHYLNEATGETQSRNPAQVILDELASLVHDRQASAESQRLSLAQVHLRQVYGRAQYDMKNWTGPHASQEAGQNFFHCATRGVSVWHHPMLAWEWELNLRRELLVRLLRLEHCATGCLDWTTGSTEQYECISSNGASNSGATYGMPRKTSAHTRERKVSKENSSSMCSRGHSGDSPRLRRPLYGYLGRIEQTCCSPFAQAVFALLARSSASYCGRHFLTVLALAGVNLLLLTYIMSVLHTGNDGSEMDGFVQPDPAVDPDPAVEISGNLKLREMRESVQPLADGTPAYVWKTTTRPLSVLQRLAIDQRDMMMASHTWSSDAIRAPPTTVPLWLKAMRNARKRTTTLKRSTTLMPSTTTEEEKPVSSPDQLRFFPLVQKSVVEQGCCAVVHSEVRVLLSKKLAASAPILSRAALRAQAGLRRLVPRSGPAVDAQIWSVDVIHVHLQPGAPVDETLDEKATWAYTLTCEELKNNIRTDNVSRAGECVIEADGIYGAIAALQSTLLQLFSQNPSGHSHFRRLHVQDWPDYPVRGLMVDMGRRFVPKEVLLREVIDGMALMRMNLLHLHLSDFCRFALDLPDFPELNLSGDPLLSGQYSVADVQAIVAYAKDRGIIVLPEVDLPGHASGLLPLEARGMAFCKPDPYSKPRPEEAAKVRDDKAGGSRKVLHELLTATAHAFGPGLRWFHVGGDEANAVPKQGCTHENVVSIEAYVVRDVIKDSLGLTPVAWEELRMKKNDLDGIKAAGGSREGNSMETIVIPWRLHTAQDVMQKGHRAIDANMHHHYLDFDYNSHPPARFWYDLSAEPDDVAKLFGGMPKCLEPSWEERPLRYLGGYLDLRSIPRMNGAPNMGLGMRMAHDLTTKKYTLEEAQDICAKARSQCAGVTCERVESQIQDATCQPRKGSPFLKESFTEDSWIKVCSNKTLQRPDRLLGGISAMWTDRYCYAYQCGAADAHWGEETGRLPNAAMMFYRAFDASFGLSLAGMIWPRAAVSASTMWHYSEIGNAKVADLTYWVSGLLRAHGVASCPAGCMCDELMSCDAPYPIISPNDWTPGSQDAGADGERPRSAADCFEKVAGDQGGRAALGRLVPGREKARPLGDALTLCFWLGEGCAGTSCAAAATSLASIGDDDTIKCKLHRAPDAALRAPEGGSKVSFFMIKATGIPVCTPYKTMGFV